MNSSRSSEVLPDPDGPVRKWKDPGRKWNVTSCSTSLPRPYRNPTPFSLITRDLLCPPEVGVITLYRNWGEGGINGQDCGGLMGQRCAAAMRAACGNVGRAHR